MSGSENFQSDLITMLIFWASIYVSQIFADLTKLPSLVYYLVFGCILGNLNIVGDSIAVGFISEIAIMILFFALGFEESVSNFIAVTQQAWGIASIGMIVPFLCGFGAVILLFPNDGIMAWLMAGLSVTATAVSLTMISLKDQGLHHSNAALGIMASAVLDDVACLVLVAIMVPICTQEASLTVAGIAWIIGKMVLFFLSIIACYIIVFPHDLSEIPVLSQIPIVNHIGVRQVIEFHNGMQSVLVSLFIAFAIGLIGLLLGFHPAIGAYIAGLILDKDYYEFTPVAEEERGETSSEQSSHESHTLYEIVKDTIDCAAFSWIGPIFFLQMGSNISIEWSLFFSVLGHSILIYLVLFIGQVLSASLAARFVPGGYSWAESWLIGLGMCGRAELFFVVLNIAYIEHEIISREMFFALTNAAMLLNITVPILISIYKPFFVGDQEFFAKTHKPRGSEKPYGPGMKAIAKRMQKIDEKSKKRNKHSLSNLFDHIENDVAENEDWNRTI